MDVRCLPWRRALALAVLITLLPGRLHAQGTTGPAVTDSKVGYIDNAITGNVIRFRYDAAYDFTRPTRAEFFYARTNPPGPGLPKSERSIDYQDVSTYVEGLIAPSLSGFFEVPVRFLNPEVNDNHAGLSDVNAGFKWSFWQTEQTTVSFQFRTYVPTGAASRGLGTHHVSLEPAVLFYHGVNERLSLAGELRYWAPAGGTDFAGDIVRYGLGVHYLAYQNERTRVTPVLEFVGWTVLSGKESFLPPNDMPVIQSASGDTILNAKLGMRVGVGDRVDFYGGYGRPITGERWYHDTFRFEMRVRY